MISLRPKGALAVLALLLVAACGDDAPLADSGSDAGSDAGDSSTDSSVDSGSDAGDTTVPDAPPTDATIDAAPCMGADGTACPGGLCYAGGCCTGCWNGTSCQRGDTAAVCGAAGADCAACDCDCTAGACTAPTVSDVTASAGFTCAIDSGGGLYCWGDNAGGQLGQSTSGAGTEVLAPTRVGTGSNWTAVGCGDEHVCATQSPGSLHCWGDNEDGQIGTGDLISISAPARVGTDTDWSGPAGGLTADISWALKSDGTLWAMGQSNYGQLGLSIFTDVLTPMALPGVWRSFSIGHYHGCGIRMDNTLWCWGRNEHGQLGLGNTFMFATPQQVTIDTNWTAVGLGDSHSCAIRGGALYCWGWNAAGQLGDGTVTERRTPTRIGTDSDWSAVDGGEVHTIALKTDGRVFATGSDTDGQLGDGTVGGMSTTLTRVVDIDGVDMITAGEFHGCARIGDGTVSCWGGNAFGALGQGDRVTSPRPLTVCVGP